MSTISMLDASLSQLMHVVHAPSLWHSLFRETSSSPPNFTEATPISLSFSAPSTTILEKVIQEQMNVRQQAKLICE